RSTRWPCGGCSRPTTTAPCATAPAPGSSRPRSRRHGRAAASTRPTSSSAASRWWPEAAPSSERRLCGFSSRYGSEVHRDVVSGVAEGGLDVSLGLGGEGGDGHPTDALEA